MQIYSYLFHTLLALFLLGISALALVSGTPLHLEMLPWKGSTLAYALLASALFALITIFLALKGTARVLFFLWSLAVFVMMVRGFFLSSYYFDDPAMLKTALYLTGGSLLAILGAWFQLRRRSMRSQRTAMVR